MEVKRRLIIAGRGKGSGPGRYALPPTIGYVNHDLTKPSSLAYTFHRRMSSNMGSVDCSPGPQYHIDTKMTRVRPRWYPFLLHARQGKTRRYPFLLRARQGKTHRYPFLLHARQGKTRRYPFLLHARQGKTRRYPHSNLLGSQVPHKPSSVSSSLAEHRQVGAPSEDRSMTPGPGRYNSTDPSVYLT
ncbi:outer dense fiber protein 3-like protein 2 [Salmo salar]|uniref:Outer dense fiber protein 3-like protein 2 n=1 Tax=Salmo salar TaxID=8030 RepID=A0ABM3D4C6_SALSA|nr:outer dense fiber protein 3-like protein 2 [Salmo salar]